MFNFKTAASTVNPWVSFFKNHSINLVLSLGQNFQQFLEWSQAYNCYFELCIYAKPHSQHWQLCKKKNPSMLTMLYIYSRILYSLWYQLRFNSLVKAANKSIIPLMGEFTFIFHKCLHLHSWSLLLQRQILTCCEFVKRLTRYPVTEEWQVVRLWTGAG